MKISRKGKTGCALVLTALMTLTGLSMEQTYAAKGIELDKKDCSIEVSVAIGKNGDVQGNEEYLKDFHAMNIPVNLYRVADVDVTGQKFTPVSPLTSVDLSGISSTTTADD